VIEFFIRRPVFAAVVSIVLTLLGAVVIPRLPIAQYPDLAPPQVNVTATYIGASADVVESAVTIPLEQELNGVEGMKYISSTSSNEGVANITITFEPTRDLDAAAVEVQNRVSRAAARLPAEVNQAGIVVNKASTQLLLAIALSTPDDRYDAQFLSNYADVYIRDALRRVPGVGDVRIFGERKFAMRIWLDPVALGKRGLTAQDVAAALREQNLQVAAGQIGQPPAPEDQPYQLSVRARGRLMEAHEFADIVLERGEEGRQVRLGDVARVELGAENYGQNLVFDGRVGVGVGVFQLPTANALEVRDAVIAEFERISHDFPPGLEYQTGNDTTLAVRASIAEVVASLAEAIGLVILVIFVFLHGWRSVVITALTLPVSLVGTFAFVDLFGFSINTLTLFGLTLATGLVVDDAIVVIENIERNMTQRRLQPREAASAAMREVAGAVIATSLVLMAVFAPVALFPGTTGQIYRQFALTIAASVALSTICALTLTPALSALLLRPHVGPKWVVFRKFDAALERFRSGYAGLLRKVLVRPIAVVVAFVVCAAATVLLYRSVPSGFIPDEDQGYLIVSIQGPEGASVGATEEVMRATEEILFAQPEVRSVFSVGGFTFSGTGSNLGTIFVLLRPWDERPDDEQSVAGLVERLRGPFGGIGGARVMPFQPPAIRGVGTVGGFQFIAEDKTVGRPIDTLAEQTQALVQAANGDERLRGIFTSFTADTPSLDVEVEREKAKAVAVPVDDVFRTLQLMMGSAYVNDFDYADRTYRVYLQADAAFRDLPRDIGAFYVRNAEGEMIPLDSLVRVESRTSAQIIRRYNLFRAAEINGQGAPGVSSGDAMAAMQEVADGVLTPDMGYEWTGISREQQESGGQQGLIFALAIVFVFLVLSAQYESFGLPLVIVLAVPIAILGGLGFVAIRGLVNDVFCQVGLVLLVGLASKNAILIVEFAEQLREQGRTAVDAAIEAAGLRLRPILMTSIAFLFGVVPLMIAQGAGAGARQSTGTVVFGGMLLSTFVNLVFTPALYVLLQRVFARLRRRAA